jgi:hypothetical protein
VNGVGQVAVEVAVGVGVGVEVGVEVGSRLSGVGAFLPCNLVPPSASLRLLRVWARRRDLAR